MTRAEFQQLAEGRRQDAAALLAAERWSGAYYLAGYAVECGLNACLMKRVGREEGGMLFETPNFQRTFCFTHDLNKLLQGTGLELEHRRRATAGSRFAANWRWILKWSEATRYRETSRLAAKMMYDAVADSNEGVLPWIRQHW